MMQTTERKLVLLLAVIFLTLCDAFCPHLCQCDDALMVVTCPAASQLDVIPITLNPMIRTLVLQGNRIRTVDASFQFYGQLLTVDFSKNQMRRLPEKCFAKQQKLLHLQMDDNEIQNITSLTFFGLKSLLRMSLRGNDLEQLTEGTFTHLTKLEYLDLGRNQLSSIDEHAFDGLEQLNVLNLDDNRFTSVPSQAFAVIPQLFQLQLGQNGIQSLEGDVFRDLNRLSVLDLSGANVYNVSEYAFRGLRRLKILRLGKNALDTLPASALQSLRHLEELYLNHNFIETISSHALPGLSMLQTLDVSYSPNLIGIASKAFYENRALKTINLSGNKRLKDFEHGALTVVPEDENVAPKLSLILNDMNMKKVDKNMADWALIGSVDLSNNPLSCDCNLKWLHNLMTEALLNANVTSIQVKALCASPEHLSGKNLSDISGGALSCSSLLTARSADDQLLLVSVCVGAALCTGLLVFAAVHCSRQKVHCRCGSCINSLTGSEDDGRGDISPSSTSSVSWKSKKSWKHILCCCCQDYQTYDRRRDTMLDHSRTGTLSPTGCYCCPGVDPRGVAIVPTVDIRVDSAVKMNRVPHHMYRDYEFNADFSHFGTKSTYYDDGDYFLSLSKDRKTFKPIPVSEL